MSAPMHEMPEHFPMPLNANGDGPETDPEKVVEVVCWCGVKGCDKYEMP